MANYVQLTAARAAIAALSKLLAKADATDKIIPLKSAINQYLEDVQHRTRPETMTQKRSAHAKHIELTQMDAATIQNFLDSLKNADGTGPIGAYGFNGNWREIKAFSAWCIEKPRQWIVENPAALIKRPPVLGGLIQNLGTVSDYSRHPVRNASNSARLMRCSKLSAISSPLSARPRRR